MGLRDDDDPPSDYPEERVVVREIIRSEKGDGGREKRLVDAILVAAIGALGWALWNLNATVAVLQSANTYQDRRLDQLEGKSFRGAPPFGDNDDIDKPR